MRGKTILALLAFMFFVVFPGQYVFAEYGTSGNSTSQTQEGRYVLVTVNIAGGYTGEDYKIPAIVLDMEEGSSKLS